jgi:hypothetical protein
VKDFICRVMSIGQARIAYTVSAPSESQACAALLKHLGIEGEASFVPDLITVEALPPRLAQPLETAAAKNVAKHLVRSFGPEKLAMFIVQSVLTELHARGVPDPDEHELLDAVWDRVAPGSR